MIWGEKNLTESAQKILEALTSSDAQVPPDEMCRSIYRPSTIYSTGLRRAAGMDCQPPEPFASTPHFTRRYR
jgi:hypothetical protein